MAKRTKDFSIADRATALTALATGRVQEIGPCLSSESMAALVDGLLPEEDKTQLLSHISHCQRCYDEWLLLHQQKEARGAKIIKGPWLRSKTMLLTAAGTFVAAAASVMLYLHIGEPPVPKYEVQSSPPVPDYEAVQSEPMPAAPPVAMQRPAVREQMAMPSPAPSANSGQEKESRAERLRKFDQEEMDFATPGELKKAATPRTARVASEAEKSIDDLFLGHGAATEVGEVEMMVDIAQVVPVVVRKMAGLAEDVSLTLLTFKRDRSLTLIKRAENKILIKEKGFEETELEIEADKLRKTLKTLLKKEFPRSNKVRIVTGG